MITSTDSYHAGFNNGFNCAEGTYLATCSWVAYGNKATRGECFQDTVSIDMQKLYANWEKKDFPATIFECIEIRGLLCLSSKLGGNLNVREHLQNVNFSLHFFVIVLSVTVTPQRQHHSMSTIH